MLFRSCFHCKLWSTGPDLLSPWRRVLLNESAYLRDNWNALKSLQWKQPGFAQKLQALLIKQNQTLNFIHQERRQLIKLGFGVFPSVEDAQAVGWGPAKRRSSIIRELDLTNLSKLFLPPHALWSMISSLLNRSIFQPRVLQVRIAIDRWRLKHPGKWPAKLDELVPDYLPEIPADPWNGKPLTWEPTSHFIQAVGSDWTTDPPRFYSDKQWFGDHPDSPGLRCELPAATAIGTPRPSAPKAPNPPIPPTE